MVKIQIDGKTYEADQDRNLLHTCLGLGFDIPYFCYHPALGSVGACRQCAVKKFKNADDKKGKIIMSCMEPVTEGLIISTNDQEVIDFRRAVIESLMTNHPHDCPVCDEGSECHLQDMTVMTGHAYRRFEFKKRTYNNQYLGPFINHEMNRCIQCYRCVRYYRDYAGGKDLHVFGSANHVYFGRHREGKLESEFSGNLVEVCPTGVFTDKTFGNHYARKWDLSNAPSVCNSCSVGCNIILSERYGTVRRVRNRYNGEVNSYFLCDRGRFGYEFINSADRIRKISIRSAKETLPLDQQVITQAIRTKKIAGIGSPHASLESNFALMTLVGKENFYHGIPDDEFNLVKECVEILKHIPARSPSMKDLEKSDALLILGDDPSETAPVLALSVRQASRNKSFGLAAKAGVPHWNDAAVRDIGQDAKSPVFIVTPEKTKLDELARESYKASPEEIAVLGFAIASLVDKQAPSQGKLTKNIRDAAARIAEALMAAESPAIITGIHCRDIKILHAAANIAAALSAAGRKPMLSVIFPECNSAGLGMFDGKPLGELFKAAETGNVETVVILENDLYGRAGSDKVDQFFDECRNVIHLDHSTNKTSEKAGILMPSATFAESTGTIVSNEGRAQRYYNVLPRTDEVRDSWKILSELMRIRKEDDNCGWDHFDEVFLSMTEEYPDFAVIRGKIPDSGLRYDNEKVARQTPRYSGRTAMHANVTVHEQKPPQDDDSPLSFSMEGYKGIPSSYLVPYYWSPGWNSPQAVNKYMTGPELKYADGNPGVRLFDDKGDITFEYFRD